MAKTSSISFPTSVSSMTGIAEVVSFCCAQEQNKETVIRMIAIYLNISWVFISYFQYSQLYCWLMIVARNNLLYKVRLL